MWPSVNSGRRYAAIAGAIIGVLLSIGMGAGCGSNGASSGTGGSAALSQAPDVTLATFDGQLSTSGQVGKVAVLYFSFPG